MTKLLVLEVEVVFTLTLMFDMFINFSIIIIPSYLTEVRAAEVLIRRFKGSPYLKKKKTLYK